MSDLTVPEQDPSLIRNPGPDNSGAEQDLADAGQWDWARSPC